MSQATTIRPRPFHKRWRFADYGFYAVLFLCGLLFYRTVETVLVPVVVGAFAAVLVRPTCDRLTRRLGGRGRIAATLCTIGVILLVVVPTVLVGWLLVQELATGAARIAGALDKNFSRLVNELPLPSRIRRSITADHARQLAQTLVSKTGELVPDILSMASGIVIGAFLFVISLYYFLVDGRRWFGDLQRIAPIEKRYVRAFAREFDAVSHALFFGSLVTAVMQGAIAAVGYLIFGVPHALLWGAATALMSLAPVVGTTVIWVPIVAVMAASGRVEQAIGLAIWGVLLIGTVDNVVRPILMNGRMRLHPLLVFLSIIGGVAAFGIVGILIGPLAAALFLAALRIYDHDYRQHLVQRDESTRPLPSTPPVSTRPVEV